MDEREDGRDKEVQWMREKMENSGWERIWEKWWITVDERENGRDDEVQWMKEKIGGMMKYSGWERRWERLWRADVEGKRMREMMENRRWGEEDEREDGRNDAGENLYEEDKAVERRWRR